MLLTMEAFVLVSTKSNGRSNVVRFDTQVKTVAASSESTTGGNVGDGWASSAEETDIGDGLTSSVK